MNKWMIGTAKYTEQQNDGSYKRVSGKYLLTAATFTEAETRLYENLGRMVRGSFSVTAIAVEELEDLVIAGGLEINDKDFWYKCKVAYQDPETEKKKMIARVFYVNENSTKEAMELLLEHLSGWMVEFEVKAIVESPVLKAWPNGYLAPERAEESVAVAEDEDLDEE